MKDTVFFIKNEGNTTKYDRNIEKIIEISNYYDNLKKNEIILLTLNKYDMKDNDYINKDVLTKIKENISNQTLKSFIIAEEDLYHNRKNLEKNEEKFEDEHSINYNYDEIECNGIFDTITVLEMIQKHDNMIVFSHFKGHPQIGFSGAIKNLVTCSIGLNGQKKLHKLAKPFISKIACLACNVCVSECKDYAISVDHVAHINQALCSGCNVCISSCPNNAIKLNKLTSDMMIKSMIEIAKSILKDKKDNKTLFINSLIDIKTHDCNINSKTIMEDIGILASYNPVALDKACYDLINEDSTEDIFKKIWRNIDGTLQFNYAEEIGFETQEYKLIRI